MFSPFGERKKNLPASKLANGPVKRVHFKNISSFDSFLGGILFTTPLVEVSWHSLCLPNVGLLFNRFMLLWFITLGGVKVRSQKSEVGSWKAEVGRPSSAFVVLDAGSREIPRNNKLKHPSCCESLIPPADSLWSFYFTVQCFLKGFKTDRHHLKRCITVYKEL